jgi:hypothetical protein
VSDGGGERATVFYTPDQDCAAEGLDPQARLNDHDIHDLDQLLPWALEDSLHQTRTPGRRHEWSGSRRANRSHLALARTPTAFQYVSFEEPLRFEGAGFGGRLC